MLLLLQQHVRLCCGSSVEEGHNNRTVVRDNNSWESKCCCFCSHHHHHHHSSSKNMQMLNVTRVVAMLAVLSWYSSSSGGGQVLAKSLNVPSASMVKSMERIVPLDHLDGVKLEKDGHLNQKFHKEVFLGDLEDFDDLPYEERRAKLDEVFEKADKNKDEVLVLEELETWIQKKLEEHFDEAVEENGRIFKMLDANHDGVLEWNEYFRTYLSARGYDKSKIESYVKAMESKVNQTLEDVQFDQTGDKDVLMRYQLRWSEADTIVRDNNLTVEEFLMFRHPEHRDDSMQEMAESIIHSLDKNNDAQLTSDEFIALPPGIAADSNSEDEDSKWQNERKTEFDNFIDFNKDGIVTLTELKQYLNPRNPVQIKNEAIAILEMIDDNYDNKLTKEEVLHHEAEFIYSKMVETARNFHDEF